jgi:hypothetical protein
MAASRSRVACWYLNAAAGEAWPMRYISSLVLAPDAAVSVFATWRRSWKCRCCRSNEFRAASHFAWNTWTRSGPPFSP